MKARIRKTKIILYLILIAATVVFAIASYNLYLSDLKTRIIPQVSRAVVQVSRILPQLKENEEALRDASETLINSRRKLQVNAGYDVSVGADAENVETVIDNTLSWMNRVIGLRVGRKGYVAVISADDFSVIAHPDERLVGRKVFPVDSSINMDTIPDIKEIDAAADNPDISVDLDLHFFFPKTIRKQNEDDKWLDALEVGTFGCCFAYEDALILCGVTLGEVLDYVILRCILSTLVFWAILWVFVRYVGFSFIWQKESKKEFRRKLSSYAVVAVALMFFGSGYFQSMEDMTEDIATMNEHAQVAVETIDTYAQYRKTLSDWMDKQYLEQCRIAAEMVKSRGKENLTRKHISEFAKDLGVKYIYVFDKNGRVYVTNSPYDHFVLSHNSEDQSYAFRPLLDGREYVIQEVREDDSSDERLQYIGVSLRDDNDLADGFVQIAVDPYVRDRVLEPINVQTVLDNLVIGLPDYALAIDKATMKVVAATGLAQNNTSIEELGIDTEKMRSGYNGILMIKGRTYYGGVSDTADLYLLPIVRASDTSNPFVIAVISAIYTALICLLLVLYSSSGYGNILLAKEKEESEKEEEKPVEEANDISEEDEERGIFSNLIKVQDKFGFDKRWKNQSGVARELQTPEMQTGRIIYRILLAFSLWLVFYEIVYMMWGSSSKSLSGFAYVILGNWEEGINMFSFTYCLFLLCVLYVFQDAVNRILYRVAKIADLRMETIFLLLRNAVKYGCALVFLYVGLAKLGVNTKALWASAGVLSLMIGFGAKDLVNDIIAGIFIIFEGTFKIGDFIMVGNWMGMVEEIGVRSTKISFFSDTKIFNNSSLRDIVNFNGEVARETVKIPVHYELDLLELEKLLTAELPKMAERIPGLVKPPRYDGVGSFDDSALMIRIVLFTVPFRRKKAVRTLLRQIKLLFDRNNISIPYNHMVVQNYDPSADSFKYIPEETDITD